MSKLSVAVIVAASLAAATIPGCEVDWCDGIVWSVCGCLGNQSKFKACSDAIQPYMKGLDSGACEQAVNRLKPLYCP
jgi:hypothetical protein